MNTIINAYRKTSSANLNNTEIIDIIRDEHPGLLSKCCNDIIATPELDAYRHINNFYHLDAWQSNEKLQGMLDKKLESTKTTGDTAAVPIDVPLVSAYRKKYRYIDSWYSNDDIMGMVVCDNFVMPVPKPVAPRNQRQPDNRNKNDTRRKNDIRNNDTKKTYDNEKKKPVPETPESPKFTKMCLYENKCTRKVCTFAHSLSELEPTKCYNDMRCANEECVHIHSNETVATYHARTTTKRVSNTKSRMCTFGNNCRRRECSFAHFIKELRPMECIHKNRCLHKASTCTSIHPQESIQTYAFRHGLSA